MSADRDVTRIVRSWLEDGATALPDRVLDSVLDQLPTTSQRRARWPVWRLSEMNSFIKVALVAAAVVVVAIVGINLSPRSGSVGVPAPSPVQSPSPATSPSRPPSPAPARIPDGPLAAGSHSTQPFVGSGGLCAGQAGCIDAGEEDDGIRITFTVPDGWTGMNGSAIVRTVDLYSPPGGASLIFMRGGWVYSQLCSGPGPDIPTGTTVDEFVTALVDHPDLDVTDPVDVTLGGYSGTYLELRAPANTTTDELGPDPDGCNYYFVWEPGIYAQGPNALWRIWVLDVDGVRVVVRNDSFPGTPPQVQGQIQEIVDSIQIQP